MRLLFLMSWILLVRRNTGKKALNHIRCSEMQTAKGEDPSVCSVPSLFTRYHISSRPRLSVLMRLARSSVFASFLHRMSMIWFFLVYWKSARHVSSTSLSWVLAHTLETEWSETMMGEGSNESNNHHGSGIWSDVVHETERRWEAWIQESVSDSLWMGVGTIWDQEYCFDIQMVATEPFRKGSSKGGCQLYYKIRAQSHAHRISWYWLNGQKEAEKKTNIPTHPSIHP